MTSFCVVQWTQLRVCSLVLLLLMAGCCSLIILAETHKAEACHKRKIKLMCKLGDCLLDNKWCLQCLRRDRHTMMSMRQPTPSSMNLSDNPRSDDLRAMYNLPVRVLFAIGYHTLTHKPSYTSTPASPQPVYSDFIIISACANLTPISWDDMPRLG